MENRAASQRSKTMTASLLTWQPHGELSSITTANKCSKWTLTSHTTSKHHTLRWWLQTRVHRTKTSNFFNRTASLDSTNFTRLMTATHDSITMSTQHNWTSDRLTQQHDELTSIYLHNYTNVGLVTASQDNTLLLWQTWWRLLLLLLLLLFHNNKDNS